MAFSLLITSSRMTTAFAFSAKTTLVHARELLVIGIEKIGFRSCSCRCLRNLRSLFQIALRLATKNWL